jgi:hypothetical protein
LALYQDYEVEVSQSQLSKVLSELGGKICLLGGWAVYLTVNANFKNARGRNFMGSRDIDLGFHIEPAWADSELRDSTFARTIARIEGVGFKPLSFRFVKHFHTETREELSEEQAKRVNPAFVFDMYVDSIVDIIHPRSKQILGFVPVDEPMLSEVFTKKKFVNRREFDAELMLPEPSVLLATKLNSVSNRDKEHKRIKDVADIYGLLWYSDDELGNLKKQLFSMVDREKVVSVVSTFGEEEFSAVARNLGIEQTEVYVVLEELKS